MLSTKRRAFAQIFICHGCCCGQTAKGHPAVPVDWLKAEFKRRKLIRNVQVTISGCLGPCDAVNAVAIALPGGMRWFGGLTETWQYASLLDWASSVKAEQAALPLPAWLGSHELVVFAEQGAPQTTEEPASV